VMSGPVVKPGSALSRSPSPAALLYPYTCACAWADAAADFARLGMVPDLYGRFLGWVGTGSYERITSR
jgi:hypothetical protein